MKFDELKLFGTGNYDIGITLEPMPHARASRYNNDGYDEGLILLARVKGGALSGATSGRSGNSSYEVNVYAPEGVEDLDSDRIILASFEFHSLQLDSAHNGILRFKGFLSAADAHPQEVYDSLVGLKTSEEFQKIPALTNATGWQLKYMPPVWKEAQQFMGYQANLTMRPYNPEK